MIKFSQIIAEKKRVLNREKKYRPIEDLRENIRGTKIRADFKKALTSSSEVALICEYKPASPSAGDISNLQVEDVVPSFQNGGASAISILTEETFFKSNIKNLRIASKISRVPLLRKDFIIDQYQIYESRSCGASAVLLMADLYPDLARGIELCHYIGMHALVECKNRDEIELALKSGAEIIGINNRDFQDFTINFQRTHKLAPHVPSDKILVSESGLNSVQDLKILGSYGADAVLVGTSILRNNRSGGVVRKVQELKKAAQNVKTDRSEFKVKICGLTRLKDIKACEKLGADFMGFINIKRSKRYLNTGQIIALTSSIDFKDNVLVIEPKNPEEVEIKVNETGIKNIQLHSLSRAEISKIKNRTHLNGSLNLTRVIGLSEEIDGPKKEEIKEFAEVCDGILFDYEDQGKTGGNGMQIPLQTAIKGASLARNINPNIRLTLAGGMDAERIRTEGKTITKFFDMVDFNSGVEDNPGVKNPDKIAEIFKVRV